jgi:nucleoid DNA-binding protein
MNTVNDIINLIARRDHISTLEAMNIVNECMEEMEDAVARGNWLEAEDILMSYLGLEPDYLDILMTEMF